MRVLEEQELVTAVWKNGKEGHIIEKVLLNDKNVAEAYAYLNRKPRREYVRENLELLEEAKRDIRRLYYRDSLLISRNG